MGGLWVSWPNLLGLPQGTHLGQQRVAHELQLVRGDVHGHVERGAQQLAALILELHEQPLHVARRRLFLLRQTQRTSVTPARRCTPRCLPGAATETPAPAPRSAAPAPTLTPAAAAILRPTWRRRRGGRRRGGRLWRDRAPPRGTTAPQCALSPSGAAEGTCNAAHRVMSQKGADRCR